MRRRFLTKSWKWFYLAEGPEQKLKVGCTNNLERRKSEHPQGTKFKVLQKLLCTASQASAIEHYWADRYGCFRGVSYAKATKESRAKLRRRRNR